MDKKIIKMLNVTKKYDLSNSPPEVKDVNLEINNGEFFVIIGPSGCGKTTILNMIAGFLKPTKGEIFVHDKRVEGPGVDRGVIFQSSDQAVFLWLTVKENIELGLKIKKIEEKKREKIVDKVLRLVNLLRSTHKYPTELSGGMKQRVQIARALTMDPEILLMDEPFANLDAITRNNMQRELLKIWEETRKTIFYVTHSIEEAIILGDRIALMTTGPKATISKIFEVPFRRPRSLISDKIIKFKGKIEKRIAREVMKAVRG